MLWLCTRGSNCLQNWHSRAREGLPVPERSRFVCYVGTALAQHLPARRILVRLFLEQDKTTSKARFNPHSFNHPWFRLQVCNYWSAVSLGYKPSHLSTCTNPL